jgi:hypothetical protein
MEANAVEQTWPQTSSGGGRKSNAVQPFLRLQNKATSWSSKSESDLTRLGSAGEISECYGSNAVSNTNTEVACDLNEMQNPNLHDYENRCKSRKHRRDVLERISILSDSTPHCCIHGDTKSRRRYSASALLDGLTVGTDHLNQEEYTVIKAKPTMRSSNPVDASNEYAVPIPIVDRKSGSVVEYGNIVTAADRTSRQNSGSGSLPFDNSKEIGVSESNNICHCVGKQKFIEGHYKATYFCDIKTSGRNESCSSLEQNSQKVEYGEAKFTNDPSSTTKKTLTQHITDEETRKKYDSLPIPSVRTSVGSPFEDSGSHIYSNFTGTNCLVHKVPTSNTGEESHYGNCTCSGTEDGVPFADDGHQRRVHSRRSSRGSSTTSSVTRLTAKRNKDGLPARLSELCIRVLINTVSTHGMSHKGRQFFHNYFNKTIILIGNDVQGSGRGPF